MTGTWAFTILVLIVAAERVAELVVSQRNLRWSSAHGGIEFGRGHYPFMVVLHVGLLAGALVEVWVWPTPMIPWLSWAMLALVLASQALRWWCIRTLGPRWNTRIVIVPGLPRVTGGPYRWLNHPNYVAVVIEGFALPMVGFAWVTAVVFTLLNLPLLAVRIRAENAALATLPSA
ncbi:MAG: isoprenylcysteine carboxyl methyltransferase family protein [Actinomycetota bacterium]|nr:isoprenylcysteine carboxyl methyltransferase family protein [Actinomycetota bacterium]